jgi:16S rRNA (cytosine1402-N4)-methyltransferase
LTAGEIVNRWGEAALADVLQRYGEVRRARAVARAIVGARPVATTTELAKIVARAAGRSRSGVHPATQTFQALRIAVNRELDELSDGLVASLGVLRERGRLGIPSIRWRTGW